jgi:hypothetical protein
MRGGLVAIAAALVLLAGPAGASAQPGMPDPKQMSGVPLPVLDAPVGSVTVRVIRGSFDNNVPGASVEFVVDGETTTVVTDDEGRAELTGLRPGSSVRAWVVVDGERLETQPIVMGASGVRVMLVATDAASVVPGTVVLGPESRVIAEMQDDRLNIFYILDVVNAAAAPVDIGGPLTFDLPRSARGTSVLPGSSPQALANGPHVTVTGPFAPGSTSVQIAYQLPYSGATARIEQVWPAALQQLNLLVMQVGGLTVTSPQLSQSRDVVDQGQPLIVGMGPAIAAGQALVLEIDGLPHHPVWPRNTALALAAAILAVGIWAAVFPGAGPDRRQRRA